MSLDTISDDDVGLVQLNLSVEVEIAVLGKFSHLGLAKRLGDHLGNPLTRFLLQHLRLNLLLIQFWVGLIAYG